MENALKSALETTVFERQSGTGGGSISTGRSYLTDNGIVWVKINQEENASLMFDGEKAGLNVILKTGTIRVPKPIKVIHLPEKSNGNTALVMEYLKFGSESNSPKIQERLGEQLAKLHLYNEFEHAKAEKVESLVTCHNQSGQDEMDAGPRHVSEFGFHTTTCCGYLPLDNSWNKDWTTFYIRQRLQPKVDSIMSEYGNRDLNEAWNKCRPIIEQKLNSVTDIKPSLLHGDLWSGNFDTCDNEPVVFDPAAFYGHSEFDLGIGYMFCGFRKPFYESYHRLIPKSEGFSERQPIYELFHHLNHWNHFGESYKSSTLQLMKRISNS